MEATIKTSDLLRQLQQKLDWYRSQRMGEAEHAILEVIDMVTHGSSSDRVEYVPGPAKPKRRRFGRNGGSSYTLKDRGR